ncbi:NTP transferase domain-containing protein [Saliphagus sp. LR7]|uniref:nucleotidyltransferase family protein n=1 Tax=Saliphagus sp. LR7 TaxID=2282654 RepID=UPI000DF7949A|nr:nucleotidyltransferase family protein [Saliphagus sp. LR7]
MSLPVVSPPAEDDPPEDDDGPIPGLVLAAGEGTRFGQENKLLAPVGRKPVVVRAVRTVLDSRIRPVTVVVGHEADRVREALSDLPVRTVENPRYREGQATSVEVGIGALPEDAPAVLIALGDMPFVDPGTVSALRRAYRAGGGTALAAAADGRRGNPVLFDRQHFDALVGLEGDVGGRGVLREEGVLVETGDPGVIRDVDRPADLPD